MSAQASNVDLNDDMQPKLYGAMATVYVLAIIAVSLRFYARKAAKQGYWWDDWLILLTLGFETALFVDATLMVYYGLGRHYQLYVDVFPAFMKSYIGGDVLYTTTNTFAKFSILAFYWRIFGDASNIRVPIYILAAFTTSWFLSTALVSIFECSPVAFTWDRTIPGGKCIDLFNFYLAVLLVNFVTDLAVVALPIRYVMRLQQNLMHRALVSGIFLLAGFVCIISIIRLVILVHTDFSSPDLTWNSANFIMWCVVETNIGIVGACLPSLGPLLVQLTMGSKLNEDDGGPQGNSNNTTNYNSPISGRSRPHSTFVYRTDSNTDSAVSEGTKGAFFVKLNALMPDGVTPTKRADLE